MNGINVELNPDRVRWILSSTVSSWVSLLPVHAAAALSYYVSKQPEAEVILAQTEITIPASVLATWSNSVALVLGLPSSVPLVFDLRLNGVLGKSGTSISIRWLRHEKSLPARNVVQDGIWLSWQNETYRIASPFFEIVGLVDKFNSLETTKGHEEQFRIWAKIRHFLGENYTEEITDRYLRNLRVVTASALGFSLSEDEQGDTQIDPVLLISQQSDDSSIAYHERVLSLDDEFLFTQRLDQLFKGATAFPLQQGTIVVVDEAMQNALATVKDLRQASAEVRKRAALYPESILREHSGLDEDTPTVFVELDQFAERVRDIGEWNPPLLPWVKIDSQDWTAPVACGIRIDGLDMPLDLSFLNQLLEEIETALEQGKPSVYVKDIKVNATIGNRNALKKLHSVMTRQVGCSQEREQIAKHVLIIETNFDEASSYVRASTNQRAGTLNLSLGLKTKAKDYQEYGISWLQHHWIQGSKGAMLCDDMGLGKTFQALAFCAWLRDLMKIKQIKQKPILIIAPVGLLRNWEAEIEIHVGSQGLGHIERVYGKELKEIKKGTHTDGTAALDTKRLAKADIILANYEAISNYQLSFGTLSFATVVLDEAQKIKSPQARMTHAVKALKTEFCLAMTGTPVENRLADFWCIADAVQPGALGDLKSFSSQFESTDVNLRSLRDQVWHKENIPVIDQPPRMLLRRLKNNKLEGLPAKFEHVIKIPMPVEQFEAYQYVLALKEETNKYSTLEMLQALRKVSLHPVIFNSSLAEDPLQVEESARFIALLEILDEISKTNEKVLIFLESLDLQQTHQLPLLLQRRYGLSRLPMVINGQVDTEERQNRVDLFQQEQRFDIMILSPKAGGVGLTLTAANHVIHLSRWWNPAVEDQCSDRVNRLGQTKPVHIYYLLALLPGAEEKSFDVQLQNLMDRKRELAQNLLSAPVFTSQDYEDLLRNIS